MRKLVLLLLVTPLAAAATLLPSETAKAAPVETPQLAAQLNSSQHDFADRINGLRTTHGLPPLVISPQLTDNANAWTVRLANGHGLFHQSMQASMMNFPVRAENVAYGPTIEYMFNLLVSSPGHLSNMLNPNFGRIGVGFVQGPFGGFYTAQEFG